MRVMKSAGTLYRLREGLGIWPHRGKVAAVGVGHSPTMRRWDGDPETSVGAWAILAIRRAIEDAGVEPSEVDGLVLTPDTSTGSHWPEDQPVPADFLARFQQTADLHDGLSQLSAEWLLKNMPELTGVQFVVIAEECMTMALTAAIQAVGDGHTNVCVAVRGWHNFPGRHYYGGANAASTVSGVGKYGVYGESLAGPMCYVTAAHFQRYMHKYGKTHDMMAPFVVNSRANGLMFPEGFFAQHRPDPLTAEDYLNAPWVAKPANLLDNDLPIHAAGAYVVATAERAKNMDSTPVFVLGHAGAGAVDSDGYHEVRPRSVIETLEEAEENAASTGRKVYEASGTTWRDLQFENFYDGFGLFHAFHLEGFGFAGVKKGEALDFFQTDISIHGPNPVSPSGGNIGSGRTRFWMHTDSIQQIRGTAGARQISGPADVGISGGFEPCWSNFIVWSKSPS